MQGPNPLAHIPSTTIRVAQPTCENENEAADDVSQSPKSKLIFCCGTQFWKENGLLFFIVLFIIGTIISLVVFSDKFDDALFDFLDSLDPNSPTTGVVFFFLLWVVQLPFMAGSKFVGLSIGLVYRWPGLALLYCGGVSGAIVVFLPFRWYCHKKQITYAMMASLFRGYRKYVIAVENSVNQHAFQVALCLALSFVPWGVTNALLAVTNISFLHFLGAIMIGRLKVILNIWVGSAGRNLIDVYRRRQEWAAPDILSFVVSLCFSLFAVVVLSFYSRKWILRHGAQQPARELRHLASETDINHGPQSLQSLSSTPELVAVGVRSGSISSMPPLNLESIQTEASDSNGQTLPIEEKPCDPRPVSSVDISLLPRTISQQLADTE